MINEVIEMDTTLLFVVGGIVAVLFGLVGYGLYTIFGSGAKELRDPIDEHAKLHELGIAHGHMPRKP